MPEHMLQNGLVQVYTGNGKGKTSAAFGAALRAVGRGLKVYIIQFIKGGFDYGELYSVKNLPNLRLTAFGRGRFITESQPPREDLQMAREGFELAKQTVSDGEYDMVVLDEINVVMHLNMISIDEVVKLIKNKPKHVELILTGRNAPAQVIEIADLVTEMKEIKHPYAQGIPQRKGIEY